MSEVKEYLEGQVKERLKRANVFEDRIQKDREEATALQKKVQKFKAENPGEPVDKVKEDLIKTQQLHYYSTLIEMQLKQEVALVKEFATMADILKVDLNLDEQQEQVVKFIRSMENNFFVVDKSGEIVIQNEDNKQMLENGLNQMLGSKERLEEIYSMIPVN